MTRVAKLVAAGLALVAALSGTALAGEPAGGPHLDARVRQFLDSHRDQWRDMNVPAVDGQLLHDLVLENGYTRALEIGTSTGHSTIWIAWALSKTGGTLITIEIDERRYRKALENIGAAGLADYVDARLVDAHELVPALEGPFDFVFSDADKDWYTHYFVALSPELTETPVPPSAGAPWRVRQATSSWSTASPTGARRPSPYCGRASRSRFPAGRRRSTAASSAVGATAGRCGHWGASGIRSGPCRASSRSLRDPARRSSRRR